MKPHPKNRFPSAEEISQQWDIAIFGTQPIAIQHHAQQLVIARDRTRWYLKACSKAKTSPSRLECGLEWFASIDQSDHCRIPCLARLEDGRIVFEQGNYLYYMMREVRGTRPNFTRFKDVSEVILALAELHCRARENRHWESIWTDSGPNDNPLLIPVEARKRTIEKLQKELGTVQPKGLLLRCFVSELPQAMSDFERSQRMVHHWLAHHSDKSRPILTHGDSHENNYLLSNHGVFLLDLESFKQRLSIQDLVVPLSIFGTQNGWPVEAIERLRRSYEEINPMTPGERCLLGSLLIFPRRWCRCMSWLLREDRSFHWSIFRHFIKIRRHRPAKQRFIANVERHWT